MSASRAIAEAAERAAWTDLLLGAPAAVRAALGIEVTSLGDGAILSGRSVDHYLINRAVGLAPDATEAAIAHYRDRGIGRFFIHGDGSRDAEAAATAAGLARYPRAWLQLLRGDAPVLSLEAPLAIDDAAPADAAIAASIYCAAFDLPAAFAPVVASVIGRPHWHALVARDGGRAVGIGLLHVAGDIGYLAGGATAPAYRQRGVQGALVAARIRRARAQGCLWVATETGEEVAGQQQHSFRNLRRCGFEVVGRRDNFAPAAMVAARQSSLAASH